MTYEELPDEWKEWIELTPLQRFRRSEELFAQYLAMGGSLDPDPDPTSPFFCEEDYMQEGCFPRWASARQRAALRLIRRGASS